MSIASAANRNLPWKAAGLILFQPQVGTMKLSSIISREIYPVTLQQIRRLARLFIVKARLFIVKECAINRQEDR